MENQTIRIPYRPRRWAVSFHASFVRFFALVLHRRIGKTTGIINHLQRYAVDDELETRRIRSLEPRMGGAILKRHLEDRRYGFFAPLLKQAKGIAWDMTK